MSQRVVLIGAGLSSMSSACYLAKAGYSVTILEKNSTPGGRAGVWHKDGFTFDMGPSWYWMPGIFESFFADFGKRVSDYYELVRLDPNYRIYFDKDIVDLPAKYSEIERLFETLEPGSSTKLRELLEHGKYTYDMAVGNYMEKPSMSWKEFASPEFVKGILKAGILKSFGKEIKKNFQHPYVRQILEYPVLFLGASPDKTPYLYTLMDYTKIQEGTWYPVGGMYQIVRSIYNLATELGVQFQFDQEVQKIEVVVDQATKVITKSGEFTFDWIVGGADYQHTETLLEKQYRNYSQSYWNSRVMSPSALIFYLGVKGRVEGLSHHTLFFDEDFERHATEIYHKPSWPSRPLFYVSCPSKTDMSVAPLGCENLFILMPLAVGLHDEDSIREGYFDLIIGRMEKRLGQNIRDRIMVKRSYAHRDFVQDYHSFKGNAYGLANTLLQTAIFKPKLKSKKVKNLLFTGQLTVPGPGVPPSLISGKIVAREIVGSTS